MEFTLNINSENEAFSDGNDLYETARILRHVADRLDDGCVGGKTIDINGNAVGEFDLWS